MTGTETQFPSGGGDSGRKSGTTVLPRAVLAGTEVYSASRDEERFDPVGRLGEGSMGLVDLVCDKDIGRLVAIKRLKRGQDPGHVMRFAREVRCMGQLEHPGIVPVHDVGRGEDGSYFLVMKHLEGETLEAVIARLREGDASTHAAFPMHERVRICEAVLRVMEYAHHRGVIHRDIKPSNIMIGTHGEVTVVDWGLAKRIEGSDDDDVRSIADVEPGDSLAAFGTQAESLLGTPLYMAPEQAVDDRDSIGVRSDVYSMAVVFYELLSLEHYLAGLEDLSEILTQVSSRVPRLAYWVESLHQERVPIELAYWLQRALQKDPENRFDSAAVMRQELQRAAGGQFDVVCPTTMSRRIFRVGMDTANRRPLATILGIVAVAGLAVFGALQLLASWF